LARLFARFDAMLAELGFLAMGGQIVDATVVEARRPRLTKEEKASVRDGRQVMSVKVVEDGDGFEVAMAQAAFGGRCRGSLVGGGLSSSARASVPM